MNEWKMIYQIEAGQWTLTGEYDQLVAAWNNIAQQNPKAKLISFEMT